jgi:hypothetical protein
MRFASHFIVMHSLYYIGRYKGVTNPMKNQKGAVFSAPLEIN